MAETTKRSSSRKRAGKSSIGIRTGRQREKLASAIMRLSEPGGEFLDVDADDRPLQWLAWRLSALFRERHAAAAAAARASQEERLDELARLIRDRVKRGPVIACRAEMALSGNVIPFPGRAR